MKEKNKAAAWAKEIWHKYNFILIFLAILVVFLVINHGATTMTTLMNIPRPPSSVSSRWVWALSS